MIVDREKETILVYPNPVTGNRISLQLNNLNKGLYSLRLYNAAGQQVISKSFEQASPNRTETLTLSVAAPGIYRLCLQGNGLMLQETIAVNL